MPHSRTVSLPAEGQMTHKTLTSLCVCMHVCIYTYICICVFMYVHVCIYTCVCICVCEYMCMYICICEYVYMYMCAHLCVNMWRLEVNTEYFPQSLSISFF